ncbi:MAG: hypothetical protein A2Z99_11630 [Treponema sp. GWB1_62_6]|nr:MAG: hypothetical protein A2Z99_11630 [Treponema sp. GWB1_62_6]
MAEYRMRFFSLVFSYLMIVLVAPARAADVDVMNILDDSTLRASIAATWFSEPLARVLARRAEIRVLPSGERVQVRVEKGPAEFMVILAREKEGAFPVHAQGSWVLYRRISDGAPTRVRIFPRSDPYMYVQLRSEAGGRAVLDAVAYGGYLVRSVMLPVEFPKVLEMPLERILAYAGDAFPRRYFEPHVQDYADARSLSAAVRGRLGELVYADDAAIDEAGINVPIADRPAMGYGDKIGLNCSGFAKWVVDGILRPLTGRRLSIDALKKPPLERGSSFSEPFDADRDPYFGLDWTRNLAASAGSVLRGARGADPAEYEVRSSPIVSLRVSGGDGGTSSTYPGYLKDAGFPLDGLKAILYALAVDDPSWFYLASINEDRGSEPVLRQHFHVAVLIPQFEENGLFRIAVFESTVETDFDAFAARYPGRLANLTRIPVETRFEP